MKLKNNDQKREQKSEVVVKTVLFLQYVQHHRLLHQALEKYFENNKVKFNNNKKYGLMTIYRFSSFSNFKRLSIFNE